jgi:hypothetical protein
MVNKPAWMNKPDRFWEFTEILAERTDGKCYIVRWAGLSGNHRPWPFSEATRKGMVDGNELEQEWTERKVELGPSLLCPTYGDPTLTPIIRHIGDSAFYNKEDLARKICALKKAGKDNA